MFCYITFVKQNIVALEGDYLFDLISKKEPLAQLASPTGSSIVGNGRRLIPEEWF